ncbi:MAG: T9SS type A sorting domain-containing protein [Chitinophagaceae bacterium]|nr:T9SS type A sorting domain-containing protein [Chitinophagaceae bacterium]
MKKSLLPLSVIIISVFTGFLIWKSFDSGSLQDAAFEPERPGYVKRLKPIEQTGIYQAQMREFELTRDLTLGYIPKDRLFRLTSDVMKLEMARGGKETSALGITWQERGPHADIAGPFGNTRAENNSTAGRVRAVWVDLADPDHNTVWVGGVAGGLWKTTNIQNTEPNWQLVNDYFDNMAIGSICQDPTNTNIMYFGTGEKTANADAVRGGGIWKSTDHGVTWNLLPGTTGYGNVSKILCDADGNVYVTSIGGAGIRRSKDKGATWSIISPIGITTRATDMVLSSAGRLHVAFGYGNVGTSAYRFTDDPANVTSSTWQSPVTTFPVQYNSALAVVGDVLYALPANSGSYTPTLYKSVDGGLNWAATPTNIPSDAYSGIGWYCIMLAVDPLNTDNVIVGGLNVYRTSDGGASWSKISLWAGSSPSLSYVHADQQYAVWNEDNVLVASDGGIAYSSDGGLHFQNRNTGLRIKQFYSVAAHPTNVNYFLGGTQDNGSHKLYKAGMDSSIEVTGGDGAFVHIDQLDPNYQFTSYTYSHYFRSTDGGQSWESIKYSSSLGQFINPTDYDSRTKIMYCGGAAGQYIRWDNAIASTNFTPVSIGVISGSVRSVSVSPYTPNRVYFGSSSGSIVRVDDADKATPIATKLNTGTPSSNVSSIAIGTSDDHLLATYSNYGQQHVWYSSDGGSTWTNVSGNLPDIPVRWAVFLAESNSKVVLATEAGVWETDNLNGSSTVWERNNTFPFVRTDMLKYRRMDNSIVAATHGRGIFTATLPALGPYTRFTGTGMSVAEGSDDDGDCRPYKDYDVDIVLDAPATGDATVTVTLKPGGTATEGEDFIYTTNNDFDNPTHSFVVPSGGTGPYPIKVRIYEDAEDESTEEFTLGLAVSGSTNALVSLSWGEHTIEIRNKIGAPSFTPHDENFFLGSRQYYVGSQDMVLDINQKSKKSQSIYRASELKGLGMKKGLIKMVGLDIDKFSTSAFSNLKVKMATTTFDFPYDGTAYHTTATTVYKTLATYNTVNGINNFMLDQPFDWDGESNIVVEFCYDNGVTRSEASDRTVGFSEQTSGNNSGIIHQNNISCSDDFTAPSGYVLGIKPNMAFLLERSDNAIATSGSKTASVYNSGSYYFYEEDDVICKLSGATAFLGCVTSNIIATGTDWKPYGNKERSEKVFSITPGSKPGVDYTIGIYYTKGEMDGRLPSGVVLIKTDAATIEASGGNSSNTVIGTTSYEEYDDGYLFTASFTGFTPDTKFFLAEQGTVIPVRLQDFSGSIQNDRAVLNWKTASEQNTAYFEVEKSADGNTGFRSIGRVNAAGNSNTVKEYSLADNRLSELNYYRLKMVDKDGKYEYSNTLLLRYSGPQKLTVVGNPFRNEIKLHFIKSPSGVVKIELFNMSGAKVYSNEYPASGVISVMPDDKNQLSTGAYILKVYADKKVYTEKVVKRK